jgi:hypothetical protein
VRRYERFLREPDVGLALDPEWSMRPGQVPGETIGSTDAATINRVSGYLNGLVTRAACRRSCSSSTSSRRRWCGTGPRSSRAAAWPITFHIDGFGGQFAKRSKYRQLRVRKPFFNGFKLFFDEDRDMLTPREVLALRPGARPRHLPVAAETAQRGVRHWRSAEQCGVGRARARARSRARRPGPGGRSPRPDSRLAGPGVGRAAAVPRHGRGPAVR